MEYLFSGQDGPPHVRGDHRRMMDIVLYAQCVYQAVYLLYYTYVLYYIQEIHDILPNPCQDVSTDAKGRRTQLMDRGPMRPRLEIPLPDAPPSPLPDVPTPPPPPSPPPTPPPTPGRYGAQRTAPPSNTPIRSQHGRRAHAQGRRIQPPDDGPTKPRPRPIKPEPVPPNGVSTAGQPPGAANAQR
ncbi:hypothetical protein F4780DRAFT_785629 [Xylariomycetidae sp. FL0641]|nr:hypothetical protein F4780DRAFT_785629 [Xylariomycetidae sp. FL0641]